MNDLDVCKSLLNIIDEMYEADGITPIMPAPDPREACHSKTHDCATKVIHPKWGEGKPMYESHAVPTNEGYVAWYDVEFDHGIEKEVPAQDMEIITLAEHGMNASKFKPHMMYDPKTGEGKMAKVEQDHLDMKAKGWGHEKPVKEDDDLEEGKLPAGLQAYQDKKNGKKDDADKDDKDEDKDDKDEDKEEAVDESLNRLKHLAGLEEAMSDAYGIDQTNTAEQVEGSVTFRQEKNTDKGSVSIEASADDMQELAKVLKLAGLTLPNEMHQDEPEQEDVLMSPEEPEAGDEESCGDEEGKEVKVSAPGNEVPADAKQTLVNIIKDKLQQRLK